MKDKQTITIDKPTAEFIQFWKEHRHSGFIEAADGKWYWGITPNQAWTVDRYRVEFGMPGRYQWTKEELAR